MDQRNAVLLVDEHRRDFLANLDPGVANSYAVLYAHANSWVAYCRRREAEGKDKWARLRERWEASIAWLDRNLVLSGATHGLRSKQLVQAITTERARLPGGDIFLNTTGQKQEEGKGANGGWLFKGAKR